jgi:hypothetical protein
MGHLLRLLKRPFFVIEVKKNDKMGKCSAFAHFVIFFTSKLSYRNRWTYPIKVERRIASGENVVQYRNTLISWQQPITVLQCKRQMELTF